MPIATVDFSTISSPLSFSRAESDSDDGACVLSGERCGRLNPIYMYFPLFLVIILRKEKLSHDLSADASSGDALSNLRR